MGKLTKAQKNALKLMRAHTRVRFQTEAGQSAAIQLDTAGLAAVYTDAGNSLGLVVGAITTAGRAALEQSNEA